ncbi:replication-relaxation family protein [Nesterenkonia muleiensis]|uniref:replication-relaxation family protein n=1 Tax=Nesterenkonia muleiensis TaxID=2282648 RepID=UPI00138FAEF1|nr:replication-relaxation family protein [Nesterenkonia muleiensis]
MRIIADLEAHKMLTTRHIQRLHFPVWPDGHATQTAATKACIRVLDRLKSHGLVDRHDRCIGGVRAGSSGYVWHLSYAGDTLQRHRTGRTKRKQYLAPSTAFMAHQHAVSEVAVTLRELHRGGEIDQKYLQLEPECWRDFLGPHGQPVTLKPDLFFAYRVGDWEEYQFLEVDKGTEDLTKIRRKIQVYLQHLHAGVEGRRWGVHPAVTWLAPDKARTEALQSAIATHEALPAGFMSVIEASSFSDSIKRPKDGRT